MQANFIEQMRVNGSLIYFYIIKDVQRSGRHYYHIRSRDRQSYEFVLRRDNEYKWHVITINLPQTAYNEIFPDLTNALDSSLEFKLNFINPN